MDPRPFRSRLEQVTRWIAEYRETIRARRVFPSIGPGSIKAKLPSSPPARAESFDRIMADLDDVILPGMTHWNHPRFHGYFTANNSEPSILAEAITATIGAQCMSWQTSPSATELEQVVMDWLRQLVGLPASFTGTIHDTASAATFVAILMARERTTGFQWKEEGATSTGNAPLRVYGSTEAHSSVEKAVFLSGIGRQNFVRIPVDASYAMVPAALETQIKNDKAQGFKPSCVVATVGTTSSTAVDSVKALGEICKKYNVFFHVDAAFAGNAAILPEFRWILEGIEAADSFVFNPHKWLYTNFDCSAFFVRDVEELLKTCAIQPEYLKTMYDPKVANFRDWGIPLGRRFRALKLWFVIRSFGVEGLQEKVRKSIALAKKFRSLVESDSDFEVLAPSPFTLVCFRYHPKGIDDEAKLAKMNETLMNKLNASGELFLTHTKLGDKYTLRFNTSQELTTEADIDVAWKLIRGHLT